MEERDSQLPWPGIWLALLAVFCLFLFGVDIWLSLAVAVVWVGTLILVSSRPPPPKPVDEGDPLNSSNMGSLLEFSGTPVIITENGRISVANRTARKLLGGHIVGQDTRMVFRQPEAIKLLERKKGGVARVTGLVRRKDIWRLNRQVLKNGLSVIELINQTAEADMSRAHTDFVANASHELRTPLASIIGYVETLQEGEEVPAKTRQKFLGTIHSEAQRLQSLVSDLMSLSRIEAEKHEQPIDTIEFQKLVKRASKDAAGLQREERLEFDFQQDFKLHGDARQLEQLVRNLVDNALKYGAEGEQVTVSLSESANGEAMLSVADRGEGIAEEHLPHLTRRFYRTDPGRSRASGGTGLGLAIVKHIVERHRGRLDISSQQGQGTTFTVRLPVAGNEDG